MNLGIRTSSQIITMDEEHQKHILATGFNHFWRGRRQKERMWVAHPSPLTFLILIVV